ncbi:MAG: hypothetical protein IJ274_07150, partial [Lachnospiraceae bacterium]|nr:hypothetical protein [Lachnospiraceae bacterium]
TIGPMCIVEEDVVIGDNCTIGAGTIIRAHTRIGNNVTMKEYCMIGIEDADIYRDEQGFCKTLPHLAGVVIEDGCLLLVKVVIAAGDTRTTVIKKGAFLSTGASLAHNSYIGEGANIGGYADIGGHCNIGARTYVAPEAIVKNRVIVGEDAFVGIGAVVLADVNDGDKVFGNPARKVPVKH